MDILNNIFLLSLLLGAIKTIGYIIKEIIFKKIEIKTPINLISAKMSEEYIKRMYCQKIIVENEKRIPYGMGFFKKEKVFVRFYLTKEEKRKYLSMDIMILRYKNKEYNDNMIKKLKFKFNDIVREKGKDKIINDDGLMNYDYMSGNEDRWDYELNNRTIINGYNLNKFKVNSMVKSVIDYILPRCKQDNNSIITLLGDPGTGKSQMVDIINIIIRTKLNKKYLFISNIPLNTDKLNWDITLKNLNNKYPNHWIVLLFDEADGNLKDMRYNGNKLNASNKYSKSYAHVYDKASMNLFMDSINGSDTKKSIYKNLITIFISNNTEEINLDNSFTRKGRNKLFHFKVNPIFDSNVETLFNYIKT